MTEKIKEKLTKGVIKAQQCVWDIQRKARTAVCDNSGGEWTDSAGKIIISVVLAGLVLAFFVALFKNNIQPNTTQKINDMYNYQG